MKKTIVVIVLVILLCISGCNDIENSVEPSTDTGQVISEDKMVNAQLAGSFTVTVRELLPDYMFDNTTICCVVATYFQDGPFVMYVGEQAAELEVGQQYTFTIENKQIGEVEQTEIGKHISYLEAQVNYQGVNIASFRKATEDELGLGGSDIQIIEMDE